MVILEFVKKNKVVVIIGALAFLVVLIGVILINIAKNNEVVNNPLSLQEKYTETEEKITNMVVSETDREGYRGELITYKDKVAEDHEATVDEVDSFLTFTRRMDKEFLSSKAHVLAYYGKIKEQYDKDVASGFLQGTSKEAVDALLAEYTKLFGEKKFQEAYKKLDEVSAKLSVRINEQGVVEQQAPATDATAATTTTNAQGQQVDANGNIVADGTQPVSNATGRAYHTEATAGTQITDPNNGNTGVVANNGIEVYKQSNETTYSYLTKAEFIEMLEEEGVDSSLAKKWADEMANANGLIPIGVEDDGTYH